MAIDMSLKARIFTFSLATFYGFLVVLYVFWNWLKSPRTVFNLKERSKPPACLQDPAYGTHNYITVNGVKIHYVENGNKSQPLMLFLHGFPEFWYSWRYQIREFSKDYWTVAIDMRGYGDSDKPSGVHNYKIQLLIDDVAGVIKALGREKCILVSHDWGGGVAWAVLKVYPHLLDKYIVMNVPPGQVFKELLATNKKQFLKSWYMFFFQLPLLPELFLRLDDLGIFEKGFKKKTSKPPTVTNEDIEAFKYTFGKPGAFTGPVNYYRGFLSGQGSLALRPVTSQPAPPGLLIFGDKDDFIETISVKMAEKSIQNLSTNIIKDANHFVQQDEPLIVNKLMREFLSKK